MPNPDQHNDTPLGESAVRVRPLSPYGVDLERFAASFRQAGSPKSMDHLQWQYPSSPEGSWGLVAEGHKSDAGFAAIYAAFGVPFWMLDRESRGAQSLDTLTAEAYRGRGLFQELAEGLYEQLGEAGLSLVYGFPNGNSVHGFESRLGWTILDPLPLLVRPLDTGYLSARLPSFLGSLRGIPIPVAPPRLRSDESIRPLVRFSADHEAIWRSFRDGRIALNRSSAYLRWRLTEKPGNRYTVMEFVRKGRALGWVATTVQDKHGGRIGYLMELLTAEPGGRAERQLLRAAILDMRNQQAQMVLAWNLPSSPNHRTLIRGHFLPVPMRFRPIELHFGVRVLDPSIAHLVRNRDLWYLSYLDSDTV